MPILYAAFPTAKSAEQAMGALVDQGANHQDLSILAHSSYENERTSGDLHHAGHAEDVANKGITTTTGADIAAGATKGLAIGTGVGIAAVFATLMIPGVGLVIGAGALAAALTAGAATAAAGTVAGGVIGYLEDQGMSEQQITHYSSTLDAGGAILSAQVPSGNLSAEEIEGLLVKYGSTDVSSTNPQSKLHEGSGHIVDIIHFPQTQPAVIGSAANLITTTNPAYAADPLTGTEDFVIPVSSVVPTKIDPITGIATEGTVIDSVTGLERRVRIESGQVVFVV